MPDQVPGDLDVTVSPHHLTTLKAAYLKLRYLVDAGCVFIGHGLKKDFRMLNIVVPPSQVSPALLRCPEQPCLPEGCPLLAFGLYVSGIVACKSQGTRVALGHPASCPSVASFTTRNQPRRRVCSSCHPLM